MNAICRWTALVIVVVSLSACGGSAGSSGSDDVASAAAPSDSHQAFAGELPRVVAFRSPTCSCCELWVEHMRAAGFTVDVKTVSDMGTVKDELPAGA